MKKNYILIIILLLLSVLAYIYQGPLKKWREEASRPQNFFSEARADDIDRIYIKNGYGEINIVKNDNLWFVEEKEKKFEASAELIKTFMEDIRKISSSSLELVSEKKEKATEFQTDDSGIILRLYSQNNQLIDVIAGKMTSDFTSSFVRKNGGSETYKTSGINLSSLLAAKEWRETKIFSFDPSKINKIRLQYPDKQSIYEKRGNDWFDGKNKVSSSGIDQLIAMISGLVSSEIPKQDFKPAGLDKSKLIVQVSGEDIDKTLMIGNEKDNKYYVKKGDSDNIYLIGKDVGDRLIKNIR